MSLQGGLSIERMCQRAAVSKAGYYRHLRSVDTCDEEMHVRSEIRRIALEHQGHYGYRRMTAELRRRGMLVNHKRVARIMREDSLIARPRQSPPGAQARCEIYINLASRMKLTGSNQLWVADITHVRLKREFVYLAVVLDRFSRRVVGWALDRTLTSRLPLGALNQALEKRRPGPGLVHHSDRGPQYVHAEYLGMLRKHNIVPSVSRPASPGDNANCESFFRTLKREEIDAKGYRDLEDLRINISAFIESYYNRVRLHSALGYRPPAEFERVTESFDAASVSSASKLDVVTGGAQFLLNSNPRPDCHDGIVSTRGSLGKSSSALHGQIEV
jgi:transposase InsO family protein